MPSEKVDRRKNRTRRLLRNALMEMILQKGYDAVTIEDITERADLGRTTFYLHYQDKEELLLESIDEIATDLKDQVDLLGGARRIDGPQPRPIHLAFHHAAEHADLYRIILSGEGATKASTRLRHIISDGALEFLSARLESLKPGKKPAVELKLVSDYFASALLGFLTWWLEEGAPYDPDQMADLFLQMFFQGAQSILNMDE
jgi:AcrR family transcriptional regulator